MEDIRNKNHVNRLKRRANFSKFVIFFKKNWLKIILVFVIICLLFFPEAFGSVVGDWLNKLVTSFIQNLTF